MDDQDQVDEFYPDQDEASAPEAQDDSAAAAPHGTPADLDDEDEARETDDVSMEDYESELAPKEVGRGDIVLATVADVQDQAVIVDLGTKYEGFVPREEFSGSAELPQVGDQIYVAVVGVDEKNERIRASKRRADYERVWVELMETAKQGQVVNALVTERVRGGLRVDVGVPGFVPASQVMVRDVRQLDRFVGRILPLRVLEVDRRSNKVILSHRQAVEEERAKRREKTLARLYEGAICEGRVVSLTEYGAFIDLGGLDGLLHISELSWHHVNHPSEVLKKNEIVRVMVIGIEGAGDRISLSRREMLPDPWKELPASYQIGAEVTGEITRVVTTGAFARLDQLEVEGFLPLRELTTARVKRADEVVKPGQKIGARILDIQPSARKLTLSMVQADAHRERAEVERYLAPTSSSGGSSINLGEHFGDVLSEARAAIEGKPAVEEASPAQEAPPTQEAPPAPEEAAQVAPEVAAEAAPEQAALEAAAEEAEAEQGSDEAEAEAAETAAEEPIAEAPAEAPAEEAPAEEAPAEEAPAEEAPAEEAPAEEAPAEEASAEEAPPKKPRRTTKKAAAEAAPSPEQEAPSPEQEAPSPEQEAPASGEEA